MEGGKGKEERSKVGKRGRRRLISDCSVSLFVTSSLLSSLSLAFLARLSTLLVRTVYVTRIVVASICTAELEDGLKMTMKQLSSTRGLNIKFLPHVSRYLVCSSDHNSLEYSLISTKGSLHETEGQELPTTITNDGCEDVKTATDIGHANTKPQEHQLPPPVPENGVSKGQEDNSDRASTTSSNNGAWEQIVVMQEQAQERVLIDLREEMEALNAEHQQDIDAANSKENSCCRNG